MLPHQDLEEERKEVELHYWIILSIAMILFILGILGMTVEYTRLGNVKLSHEDTKFSNIEIPFLEDLAGKSYWEQLSRLLLIRDEQMRNHKSPWATALLCFSFSRNLRHLFYKFKPQEERVRHRQIMYFVWCVGFIWNIMFVACYVGIQSFPQNIWVLPQVIARWPYIFVHGGMMFGVNMMFLAWGYITAVNFLNFSNFIPKDFFEPLFQSIKFLSNKINHDEGRQSIA